ncbi:hypothetical protein HPB49_012805 [Dermacentor silvarum]|uniref:Uncharacterized protein n=1 Tax=Dermacentor silvarum TaxID=543639 RepID=A0ACB8E128_DERSI|nr:hypothetical protein HPB49_012805 [Dermacentor silvarum]
MNLKALKRPELLNLARELGLQIAESKRKPEIIEAIEAVGADDDELEECLESIEHKEEERKRLEAKEEHEREQEQKREEHRIRIEEIRQKIQFLRGQQVRSRLGVFKVGENLESFLALFEKVCAEVQLDRENWSFELYNVFPFNVSCVLSRLSDDECRNYDTAKRALFRQLGIPVESDRKDQGDEQRVPTLEVTERQPTVEVASGNGEHAECDVAEPSELSLLRRELVTATETLVSQSRGGLMADVVTAVTVADLGLDRGRGAKVVVSATSKFRAAWSRANHAADSGWNDEGLSEGNDGVCIKATDEPRQLGGAESGGKHERVDAVAEDPAATVESKRARVVALDFVTDPPKPGTQVAIVFSRGERRRVMSRAEKNGTRQ